MTRYDTFWQLFCDGPIWDGDILSKSERDSLIKDGFAERTNGWAFLTKTGVERALSLGMGTRKEQR